MATLEVVDCGWKWKYQVSNEQCNLSDVAEQDRWKDPSSYHLPPSVEINCQKHTQSSSKQETVVCITVEGDIVICAKPA